MNCLFNIIVNVYKRINTEYDFDTLEDKVYIVTKDFISKNLEITNAIDLLKDKIQKKYKDKFPEKIMLSLLHKTDRWNITEMNGKYIVASNFNQYYKCQTRYLVLVNQNNIKIVDEMIINKDVNPKNIIS